MENIYTETYLQKYLHGDSKLETSEKCFTIGIFGKEFKILRLNRIIICFNAECLSKFKAVSVNQYFFYSCLENWHLIIRKPTIS